MNNLTEVKTATKLLGLLCEKGNLDNTQVDQLFKDTGQDAVSICKILEIEGLIKVVWLDFDRIANIKKTDKTCNDFKTINIERNISKSFWKKLIDFSLNGFWIWLERIGFLIAIASGIILIYQFLLNNCK